MNSGSIFCLYILKGDNWFMDICIILIVVLIFLIVADIGINIIFEYKLYNHGVCKNCGGKLLLIDTDSQSNRLYMCNKCQCSVWVSWPVD